MFKKSLLISVLIANLSLINAQNITIDNIVETTYSNNYTLKALEESIKSAKEQINLSSKWKNPTLTFGATDIQFDDITRRDLEPMQGQFIGFSQVIPMGDKLEIEKKIATNDYQISKYSIEDKKLQYKSKIYEYIYKIKLLEERLSLFEEFKSNTSKLENLLTELYKYNKASQTQILNTQIMYQELNLKSQKLKTMLNTINLKLEQITYKKIEDINIHTNINEIILSKDIESHPKILSLTQVSKKQENISILEKEKKNSDIKVSLTYVQRDEKFEDYVNVAFAIPLSVYGSEDIKSRKAKFKTLEINNKLKDMKLTFKNQIKTYQQNINDSIITLNIINKNIIPKIKQLQKVLETYNSFNSYKKVDSKSLINNFNEIIKYRLKAVDEKEKYFSALAKSIYFTKEI
ncbi:TolC family protein [Arcobacter sp. LA11]|uniref:TolC family protein n=1 Tax=Arcobacter sp. LA11 TaxID=1898176 RepID=UPI000932291B|nr:TolC family protein [Arcobacter sp. LA11]